MECWQTQLARSCGPTLQFYERWFVKEKRLGGGGGGGGKGRKEGGGGGEEKRGREGGREREGGRRSYRSNLLSLIEQGNRGKA